MVKYAVLATLMLLAIGLGSFQYWAVSVQETASATIGDVDDKVDITPGSPTLISNIVPWRPFGVGNTSEELYNITLPSEYNGDYIVTLHLVNADDVAEDLRYLIMKVELYNNTYSASNKKLIDSKWLSLINGRVQFQINQSAMGGSTTAYIYITDGVGKALWPKVCFTVTNPTFVIDVEEIGAGS